MEVPLGSWTSVSLLSVLQTVESLFVLYDINALNKQASFLDQTASQYDMLWAWLCVNLGRTNCICQNSRSCIFWFLWARGRFLEDHEGRRKAAVNYFCGSPLLLLICWFSSLGRCSSWASNWSTFPWLLLCLCWAEWLPLCLPEVYGLGQLATSNTCAQRTRASLQWVFFFLSTFYFFK